MTKDEALRAIKELRGKINDVPDPTDDGGWVNNVLYHLDQASDVIEFPEQRPPKDITGGPSFGGR